jgi:outer membrane murein-binding lipoprotein Lpp
MYKKLTSLASILIASALIAGCSNTVRDNTMKVIQLTPSVQGVPMVAELEVANQKVMGQAKGKAPSKSELEKEAVAEALKQTYGDVLVGANFFYEYVDKVDLTVTVIGYPARYKNFRPKEVPAKKDDILVGGNFYYEDGSKNNISVTIKNPKSADTAPAAPVAPPATSTQNPVHLEKATEK